MLLAELTDWLQIVGPIVTAILAAGAAWVDMRLRVAKVEDVTKAQDDHEKRIRTLEQSDRAGRISQQR